MDSRRDLRRSGGTPVATLPTAAEIVEVQRLIAVRRYDILDTPPDPVFDRITALAARLFEVPVAGVTIVDSDRIWFKSIHGLDGVSQVDREAGLCATAITADSTLVINDTLLDPVAAQNQLVSGPLGVRFYAGVPLRTPDGYRLGTLNILDTEPRELDDDGRKTLALLADLVVAQLELRLSAVAVVRAGARLRQEAHGNAAELAEMASALQQTLVPAELPKIPGLELAGHYHLASAGEIGADFYDFFPVDTRRWGFYIGDVSGKGATAATRSSFIRGVARAAAVRDSDPEAMLGDVNQALLTRFDDSYAVMLTGLLEREEAGWTLTIATGGHQPPFLITSTGTTVLLPVEGTAVGVTPQPSFGRYTGRIDPGDMLLLYTDGLVNALPGGGEYHGHTGLSRFLNSRSTTGAVQLVADLSTLITGLVPSPDDDVALLAISVPT